MRHMVVLAEGALHWHSAKTAVGVIRYGHDRVVAIIDSTRVGADTPAILGGVGAGIPIVRDIHEALTYQPDTLLIGIAPVGGALPAAWRGQILTAIQAGLDVISGLHEFIGDDPDLALAARNRGVTIWDVRQPPRVQPIAQFTPHRPGSHTVLTVGSDCSVGKMTVSIELDRAARERGLSAAFAATGQTGIIISGRGMPVDRLISDFAAGCVERMVLEFIAEADWVFVEGQGSLIHPAYSPVTLALVHGALPDAIILCHEVGRDHVGDYENHPIPPLTRLIAIYEETAGWLKPARVAGIALNTYMLDEAAAHVAIARAEEETGLPVTDCIRFGAGKLIDALIAQ